MAIQCCAPPAVYPSSGVPTQFIKLLTFFSSQKHYNLSMERHSHDDYRKLVYRDGSYDCQGCKEQHFGFRYQCKKICKLDFCQSCSVERRNTIPFAFSGKRRMVFEWKEEAPLDSENRDCITCGRNVRGFHYESKDKSKNHVLHPTCAHAPGKMDARGVGIRLVDKTNSKCIACCNVQHPTYNKSSFYEFDKAGRPCVHVACTRRLIEEGGSHLQTELALGSRHEKYWKKAELLLGVFIAFLSGNPVGAIGGLLANLGVGLFRGLCKGGS